MISARIIEIEESDLRSHLRDLFWDGLWGVCGCGVCGVWGVCGCGVRGVGCGAGA